MRSYVHDHLLLLDRIAVGLLYVRRCGLSYCNSCRQSGEVCQSVGLSVTLGHALLKRLN